MPGGATEDAGVGADELVGAGLSHPETLALADKVELVESEAFNARFPARRFAQVQVETLAATIVTARSVRSIFFMIDPL